MTPIDSLRNPDAAPRPSDARLGEADLAEIACYARRWDHAVLSGDGLGYFGRRDRDTMLALVAEVKRLRRALEEISEAGPDDEGELDSAPPYSPYSTGKADGRNEQGQRAREALAEPAGAAEKYEWWCPNCHAVVPPEAVTYEERHDIRAGGCGEQVGTRPVRATEAQP